MSICVWVKHDEFSVSVNNWARVFHFGNSFLYDNWWLDAIYLANDYVNTHAYFSIVGTTSGDWKQVYATNIFSTSEWIFVTLVVQGTTMKIYKNGILSASNTDAHEPELKVRSYQYLGHKGPTGSDCWLKGKIDDLKIYNRALTDAEITSLYNEAQDWTLPVTLSNFSAKVVSNGVALDWSTESEIENLGFMISRKSKVESGKSDNGYEIIASFVDVPALVGHGSTTEKHDYQFTDKAVRPGAIYTYLLSDVSYTGIEKKHTDKTVMAIIPANQSVITEVFRLGEVYPNPFNAVFTIPLALGKSSPVKITLCDLNGKVVKIIENGVKPAGEYRIAVDCRELSSGIYFLQTTLMNLNSSKKIVLIK